MKSSGNKLVDGLKTHTSSVSFDEPSARAALESLLTQPLLPVERDHVESQMRNFAGYWFISRLGHKYTPISAEMFKLTRRVEQDGITADVPTFFSMDFRVSEPSKEVEIKTRYKGSGTYDTWRDIAIKARVPPVIPEARTAYVGAVKFAASITQKAFDDDLLCRILTASPHYPLPVNAGYTMIWAPDKVELRDVTPVPEDPALIMKYWGVHFLVHRWDSDHERPLAPLITNFQREFSYASGSLREPAKE